MRSLIAIAAFVTMVVVAFSVASPYMALHEVRGALDSEGEKKNVGSRSNTDAGVELLKSVRGVDQAREDRAGNNAISERVGSFWPKRWSRQGPETVFC